ncbi:MAG: hypothetical protein K2Q24_15130 [Chitinophagaceae bacterium]|jgi:hypothetical protein|nr:hypothetical protein [Chitinophagaceae bacterium]
MELIRPAEISGKIMTLIESAKEKVIIVSPYNRIDSWTKLTNRIKEAKNKGVKFEWFIRKNVDGNYREVADIGITPIEIENLHCKIYLNEKTAIVTSMNLHYYSDTNSIDIGYCTTNENEYLEIVDFVNLFVKRNNNQTKVGLDNPISEIKQKKYHLLLTNFLKKNEFLALCKLSNDTSKYGEKITVENFKQNYQLIFEPRFGYYRVDLRICYDYQKKVGVYEKLKTQSEFLENKIGHSIDFGNQMKRLKIDITENIEERTSEWTEKHFLQHQVLFSKIISVFNSVLE